MRRLLRAATIGLTAFLTVVDLFATQALLPPLAAAYGVSPAVMGVAVNATTFGMAAGGLAVGLFGRQIDRRRGILVSLVLLAVPTGLLAAMPDLAAFAALRIVQGLCMSTAFALTLAWLGERGSAAESAGAVAAYITGNVASNLVGRLLAAGLADHLGLAAAFGVFAGLNLAGALLVWVIVERRPRPASGGFASLGPLAGVRAQVRTPALRAALGVGFLILFAFIGVFTYVNFVLVAPPFGVGMMMLGAIYLVFLPSIVTTPLAGRAVARHGARACLCAGLAIAAAGLPLLLAERLALVLAGLALVAVGTFFAQAVATGFVGRAAGGDRGTASGLYLASYFLGGLAGSALLGWIFDRFGWPASVAAIGVSLLLALALSSRLVLRPSRAAAEAAALVAHSETA